MTTGIQAIREALTDTVPPHTRGCVALVCGALTRRRRNSPLHADYCKGHWPYCDTLIEWTMCCGVWYY